MTTKLPNGNLPVNLLLTILNTMRFTNGSEIVDEITMEQRVELLKFVTALNHLPVGGFKSLQPAPSVFIIDEKKKVDYYPKSSTCFNQIRLYPASSKQKLKEIIISAALNGSEGFSDR